MIKLDREIHLKSKSAPLAARRPAEISCHVGLAGFVSLMRQWYVSSFVLAIEEGCYIWGGAYTCLYALETAQRGLLGGNQSSSS